MKRAFDLILSSILLIIFFPFFLLLALVIKLDSSGPIFYKAERAGQHGKIFNLYKFRSMVDHAQNIGPGITRQGDLRVTRVGSYLRMLKLDELPQLINVVKGEMSLVGPRPEDPLYVARYTPLQRQVLSIRPGITSPAALRYRHEENILVGEAWEDKYLKMIIPDKLLLDLEYIQKQGFWTDIKILWQTFLAIFK
jgi:lipopolysaccharide/colanic/teichoic acid biosynthesis glycosyltransferase